MSEILYNVRAMLHGEIIKEIRNVSAGKAVEVEENWSANGISVIANEEVVNMQPDEIEIYKTVTIWKRKG